MPDLSAAERLEEVANAIAQAVEVTILRSRNYYGWLREIAAALREPGLRVPELKRITGSLSGGFGVETFLECGHKIREGERYAACPHCQPSPAREPAALWETGRTESNMRTLTKEDILGMDNPFPPEPGYDPAASVGEAEPWGWEPMEPLPAFNRPPSGEMRAERPEPAEECEHNWQAWVSPAGCRLPWDSTGRRCRKCDRYETEEGTVVTRTEASQEPAPATPLERAKDLMRGHLDRIARKQSMTLEAFLEVLAADPSKVELVQRQTEASDGAIVTSWYVMERETDSAPPRILTPEQRRARLAEMRADRIARGGQPLQGAELEESVRRAIEAEATLAQPERGDEGEAIFDRAQTALQQAIDTGSLRMSIPARVSHDHDLIISDAIEHGRTLARELREAKGRLDTLLPQSCPGGEAREEARAMPHGPAPRKKRLGNASGTFPSAVTCSAFASSGTARRDPTDPAASASTFIFTRLPSATRPPRPRKAEPMPLEKKATSREAELYGNRATLPQYVSAEDDDKRFSNARNLSDKKEETNQKVLVAIGSRVMRPIRETTQEKSYIRDAEESGIDEVVSARWWMSRRADASVVYCSVWIRTRGPSSALRTHETDPCRWLSGRGTAGGFGYHKESAAFADALRSAGIELERSVSGVGDGAIEDAMRAVARAAGYKGCRMRVV